MSDACCTPQGNIMLLSCSGGSNVGQLANQAAVELTREGFGRLYCLAGIAGHLDGFVRSARDVPEVIVVDGCPIGCGKAVFDHLELPLKHYLVVTDLGIEKNHDFELKRAEIDRVKAAVRSAFSAGQEAAA